MKNFDDVIELTAQAAYLHRKIDYVPGTKTRFVKLFQHIDDQVRDFFVTKSSVKLNM